MKSFTLFGGGWDSVLVLVLLASSALFPTSHGFLQGHRTPLPYQTLSSSSWRTKNNLLLYGKAAAITDEPWYQMPLEVSLENGEDTRQHAKVIEQEAIALCAEVIQRRLRKEHVVANGEDIAKRQPWIQDHFMDLACTPEGESVLESLLYDTLVNDVSENVLRAAVMALQSLCIFGTQVGVKGTPDQLRRRVAHLNDKTDDDGDGDAGHPRSWDHDSVRHLKHKLDRTAAVQLLAELKWKRTTQGAAQLLRALGAWETHEDLALLRSGFPIRFSQSEIEDARTAVASPPSDVDAVLGLRKDLRHLKVFTVDGPETSEIDDGISLERIESPDGSVRTRVWIHIADAEHWAPTDSSSFRTAQARITSLYLPSQTISMFPTDLADAMSLQPNIDNYALSLAVEVNPDGSIDKGSIAVVPALIRVTYRLTYDEVDEMLEEGIGYREEWELGALLDTARQRRDYRVGRGSAESMVPNPIPSGTITVYDDDTQPDGIAIKAKVVVSHNAGQNQTLENTLNGLSNECEIAPMSSSFLLVTESMILAGEAIGQWKVNLDRSGMTGDQDNSTISNQVRLPFRTQPPPDFRSRARERRMMEDLRKSNAGLGYCYAWYARRFLLPVKISEYAFPHAGLGLDYYVQWTSPIRRFSDLQTHVSAKRFLRRQRLGELLATKSNIPFGLMPGHFGFSFAQWPDDIHQIFTVSKEDLDTNLNFLRGVGLIGAARTLQRQSQNYWLFELVRRRNEFEAGMVYKAIVLGCVDPDRQQYAIYLPALGLEHRYTSSSRLDPGVQLRLCVDSVYPQLGLLSFFRTAS